MGWMLWSRQGHPMTKGYKGCPLPFGFQNSHPLNGVGQRLLNINSQIFYLSGFCLFWLLDSSSNVFFLSIPLFRNLPGLTTAVLGWLVCQGALWEQFSCLWLAKDHGVHMFFLCGNRDLIRPLTTEGRNCLWQELSLTLVWGSHQDSDTHERMWACVFGDWYSWVCFSVHLVSL
jgi:hypothetical protein